MPPFFISILALTPLIIGGFYSPISKGILLGNLFYNMEVLNEHSFEFATFGTLWRNKKTIIADLQELKIDKLPMTKLLYNKYALNIIYINDNKYYIFNSLLNELLIDDNV